MKKIVITLISVVLILVVINWYGLSTPIKNVNNLKMKSTSKPVVLVVVDSLMDEPLQKAIGEGRAPAFAFLSKHGQYFHEVVSSYPTMSVTIDSTLLTGTYANQHRLPGLVWYSQNDNRLVNYGSGKKEVFTLGVKQVLKDGIYNLNQEHLGKNVKTIYEDLDERQAHSASINGLIYRGNQDHNLHVPKIASTLNILPDTFHVKGPTLLSMGSLSQYSPENNGQTNIWQELGFNDTFTANEVKHLIQNDSLPSFTLAYFPDLDHRIHKHGPMDLKGIEKVDQHLQTILDAYPTWDEAIEEMTLIVSGDSSQSKIGNDRTESLIDLTLLSKRYQVAELGEPITKKDQIVLAVNERMAYINLLDDKITFSEMASKLMDDSRISFIAWKDEEGNHVLSEESNKKLTFQPEGKYTDHYHQEWDISGDFSILDLSVNKQNEIKYGDYPDALARLYGALHSHKGRYLVVDAKPGYEFIGEHSPTHDGGAGHGSLHKRDSLTPMIITGTNTQPEHERIVDYKEWILELTK
ncbi:phosphodiesterase [Virgibacillus necropolis]|uniref:Phosphodiesterase n=1 Tax=Virgibacillus necropolis TaxID=163877 RepID=A0A221MIE2_9BACI|nr:phosphodiesterase [Virgibacillus necropolis]